MKTYQFHLQLNNGEKVWMDEEAKDIHHAIQKLSKRMLHITKNMEVEKINVEGSTILEVNTNGLTYDELKGRKLEAMKR